MTNNTPKSPQTGDAIRDYFCGGNPHELPSDGGVSEAALNDLMQQINDDKGNIMPKFNRRVLLPIAAAAVATIVGGTAWVMSDRDSVQVALPTASETNATPTENTGAKKPAGTITVDAKGHQITVTEIDLSGDKTVEHSELGNKYHSTVFLHSENTGYRVGWEGDSAKPLSEQKPGAVRITRITSSNPGLLPSSSQSISPAGWLALSKGKKPKQTDISIGLDREDFQRRVFGYAKHQLQDTSSPSSIRANALKTLAQSDLVTITTDNYEGKPVVVFAMDPGPELPVGQDNVVPEGATDRFTMRIDPATGLAVEPQFMPTKLVTTKIDQVPAWVVAVYEEAKQAGKCEAVKYGPPMGHKFWCDLENN